MVAISPHSDRSNAFVVQGNIDAYAAAALAEMLVEFADSSPDSDHLELDCTKVRFIDASGISALRAVMRKTGRAMSLRHVQRPCRRVLEITGLDEGLLIRDD